MATGDEPPPRAVVTARAFERDARRLRKRGKDMGRLRAVVEALRPRQPLDPRHRDHALTGDRVGFRDGHAEADWVLVARLDEGAVDPARTGTHADLFG